MTLVQKRDGVWEGDECLVCRRRPAPTMRLRGFGSFLIFIRNEWTIGPLCRDHAVQIAENFLRRTLTRGWWGVGLLVMPVVVPMCLLKLRKAKRIPPPEERGPAARPAQPLADPAREVPVVYPTDGT